MACGCWAAATVGPNGHTLWRKPLAVVFANFFMHLTAVNKNTRKMTVLLPDGEISNLLKRKIAVAGPVMIGEEKEQTGYSEFRMSRIVRAEDAMQTDALIKSRGGNLVAVVECKNHTTSVGSKILMESVKKGRGAPLRLLVCKTVAKITHETKNDLNGLGIRCLVVRARTGVRIPCWELEPMNEEPKTTKITTVVVPVDTLRAELGDWMKSHND
jgi:hypothetical protein